jgi:hypothetical protein
MRKNMTSFRVFGPDETASNKLDAIYEASEKTWLEERLPSDDDGGFLSSNGRVMEMLSEHTLEGWFEGYLLTGRHGLFATYESFVHVIDSMFNQHASCVGARPARRSTCSSPPSSGGRTTMDLPTRIPASSTSSLTKVRRSRASTFRPTRTVFSASPTTACAAPTT